MPDSNLDTHGQPANFRINQKRRVDRGIHEMLGICRGVLSDGVVVEKEADYLNDWVSCNPDLAVTWPVDVLARRLRKIFADGRVDDDERLDLAELLHEIAGGKVGVLSGEFAPTSLPIDRPPPDLIFTGKNFVFTGKFALGPREICEDITYQRGAFCQANVSQQTDFLVIGTFGSKQWAHSSFGRKIMKAVECREKCGLPQIISEDHWAQAIH